MSRPIGSDITDEHKGKQHKIEEQNKLRETRAMKKAKKKSE